MMIGLGPSTLRCVRLDVVTVYYWRAFYWGFWGRGILLYFTFCLLCSLRWPNGWPSALNLRALWSCFRVCDACPSVGYMNWELAL